MEAINTVPTSHGGILFPLDMFRPTHLAAAIADVLVSKVRNILDATIEICRHPGVPLVLARIHGTVVGDDPAEFWRENQDLALVVSQVTPRQCFVYFARDGEDRREGFLVAQRGQAVAADDSNRDDGKGTHWPVTRLCEQMRISPTELADGFAGGPRIELSLMEPHGNDQALLMTLAGQPPGGEPEGEEAYDDEPQQPPPPPPARGPSLTQGFGAPPAQQQQPAAQSPAAAPSNPPPARAPAAPKPGLNAAEDVKRRATEKAAELQEISQRGNEAARKLKLAEDDLGAVVALPVELSEMEILRPFQISRVDGNAPDALPGPVRDRLQGRSLDFAVVVEFLSEVFVDNQPLNRAKFDERAKPRDLDGLSVKALEVHAPRLGPGTLIRHEGRNVFLSRAITSPVPAALVVSLLKG